MHIFSLVLLTTCIFTGSFLGASESRDQIQKVYIERLCKDTEKSQHKLLVTALQKMQGSPQVNKHNGASIDVIGETIKIFPESMRTALAIWNLQRRQGSRCENGNYLKDEEHFKALATSILTCIPAISNDEKKSADTELAGPLSNFNSELLKVIVEIKDENSDIAELSLSTSTTKAAHVKDDVRVYQPTQKKCKDCCTIL